MHQDKHVTKQEINKTIREKQLVFCLLLVRKRKEDIGNPDQFEKSLLLMLSCSDWALVIFGLIFLKMFRLSSKSLLQFYKRFRAPGGNTLMDVVPRAVNT